MEPEKFKLVTKLYQFLRFDNHNIRCQFGGFNGNYKSYPINEVNFPEATLKLIDDLMELRVVDFYKLDYLKNNGYPEKFYNASLTKKSETEYGFHYQLPTILFDYLFFHFKETAIEFLNLIKSTEFKSTFGKMTTIDRYDFKYPSSMHDIVFKYFDSKIPHFNQFHHQLNWLTDMSYTNGYMTFYKIERIKNCIKNLERFDFGKINLNQELND